MTDSNPAVTAAARLNRDCHCRALNRQTLQQQLLGQTDGELLYNMISTERPNLASDALAFIDRATVQQQQAIIDAVESVVAMPSYQQRVLSYAPATAQFQPKADGVFLGYDFHLGNDGPQLIEINSNAGGALLNVELARAISAYPHCGAHFPGPSHTDAAEQAIIAMFRREWALEQPQRALKTIAIVDCDPQQQYMLPEFMLFRNCFARHGIEALICDPGELEFRGEHLYCGEKVIDLVYNRLTDFALQEAPQRALLDAFLARAVAVTPHPRNHALYADKRNLAILSDPCELDALAVDDKTKEILLHGIAKTTVIGTQHAESLWQRRKQLFFKPAKGYGSKAAYRGDKVTLRVFDEVLHSDYVAQALVTPSERRLLIDGQEVSLKLDLRHYVYHGQSQWLCARLYQGQTTNFRTPGGGFAQVVVVD
jgi:hypothetical protein